ASCLGTHCDHRRSSCPTVMLLCLRPGGCGLLVVSSREAGRFDVRPNVFKSRWLQRLARPVVIERRNSPGLPVGRSEPVLVPGVPRYVSSAGSSSFESCVGGDQPVSATYWACTPRRCTACWPVTGWPNCAGWTGPPGG